MPDSSDQEEAQPIPTPTREQISWLAESAAAGEASASELAVLERLPVLWHDVLEELLEDTEEGLVAARSISGPERAQVVADFESERSRLVSALERFVIHADAGTAELLPSEPRLQVSWAAGRVVAWGGGPGVAPVAISDLPDLLESVGAPAEGWGAHRSVVLPSGAEAPALSLPVQSAVGWLAGIGAQVGRGEPGASVR